MQDPYLVFLNIRSLIDEQFEIINSTLMCNVKIIFFAKSLPNHLKPYIKHFESSQDLSEDEIIQKCIKLSKEFLIQGVFSWTDTDVVLSAKISDALKIRGLNPHAAYLARNKYEMRKAVYEVNPNIVPRFVEIKNNEDIEHNAPYIGFPSVLKPISASGSKGIFIVKNLEEAKDALNKLIWLSKESKDKIFYNRYGEIFIFESYIDGQEFSVEGFVSQNKLTIAGITHKLTTEKWCLEHTHIFPAPYEEKIKQEIEDAASEVVKALKLNFCPIHLEGKWTKNGFKLIEIAARIGGDLISTHLVSKSLGINWIATVIRSIFFQDNIHFNFQPLNTLGIKFILAEYEGTFKGFNFNNSFYNIFGIISCKEIIPRNQIVSLPPDDFSLQRLGYIIAQGQSFNEIIEKLQIASDCIDHELKEQKDKNQDEWILLLGGLSPNQGANFINEAHTCGYKVLVTDQENEFQKNKDLIDLADETSVLDYTQTNDCLHFVESIINKINIKLVYSFREKAMYSVSILNQRLNIPWTLPLSVELIRNKYSCRKFLELNGFMQPKIYLCKDKLEFQNKILELNILKKSDRYIFKPVTGMGSEYIYEIPLQLDAAMNETPNHIAPFLLEEFIEGKEYSAEGLCVNGKPHIVAITEKFLIPNTFIEIGHCLPANLSKDLTQNIKTTIEDAATKIGLTHGVLHIEFWIQEDKIILGEFHNRPGGQLISLLTSLFIGNSIYKTSLEKNLKSDFIVELNQNIFNENNFFAVWCIAPKKSGKINLIEIPPDFKNDPDILFLDCHAKIGEFCSTDMKSNFNLFGTVACKGDSQSAALIKARNISNQININAE